MHYTIITAEDRKKRPRNVATGDTTTLLRVLFRDIDMEGGGDLCLFRFQGAEAEKGDRWAASLDDEGLAN